MKVNTVIERYTLRDGKGCLWDFDSFDKVINWIKDNPDDAPFSYFDRLLDDVVEDNEFKSIELGH